jgi:ribosomal protein S18 acetylase RimI-like enzyme
MIKVSIRKATEKDSDAIGILHATSWKITYRNILPDSFLDNDLEGERKKYWSKKMAGLTANDFVLVATSAEEKITGFIAVLHKPEKGYKAFIDNLHVHPDLKGHGIGSKLMNAAAERLCDAGIQNAYLWVFKGNDKAEGFYKTIGGRPADISTVNFAGSDILRTRFVWDDLKELLNVK